MPGRIFMQQKARDQFFRIHRATCFDDKTTRNQRRSTDKLAPMRNVKGVLKRWTQFRTAIFPELCMVCE